MVRKKARVKSKIANAQAVCPNSKQHILRLGHESGQWAKIFIALIEVKLYNGHNML
jgi:hypothetical protein